MTNTDPRAYVHALDFFGTATGQYEVRMVADNPYGYTVLGYADSRSDADAMAIVALIEADTAAGVLPAGIRSLDDIEAHGDPNAYFERVIEWPETNDEAELQAAAAHERAVAARVDARLVSRV